MYHVVFTNEAKNELKKMDRYTALLLTAWVRKNLEGCSDHRQHGKSLTANRGGQWRYRIGDYRLVAEINDETITILILTVGHRRDVYEK